MKFKITTEVLRVHYESLHIEQKHSSMVQRKLSQTNSLQDHTRSKEEGTFNRDPCLNFPMLEGCTLTLAGDIYFNVFNDEHTFQMDQLY